MILVVRCAMTDPQVPSGVVACCICGSDCWLSKETGPTLIDAAIANDDGVAFVCTTCFLLATL